MRFEPTTFTTEISGSGRPTMLIPGFACSSRVWDATVAHLAGAVEMHAITLAGFADTAAVLQPSLARIEDELARYVVENGLDDAVVIGHSLGGTLALGLATSAPGIGAVIDVEGQPFLGGVPESVVARMRAMTPDDLEAWIQRTMGPMFAHAEDRERVLRDCAKSDVATVAQLFGEGMNIDLRADLDKITAEVTVVVATDCQPPAEDLRERWHAWMAPLPKSELVFMTGSHFVMYDQPDEFNALVNQVLGI